MLNAVPGTRSDSPKQTADLAPKDPLVRGWTALPVHALRRVLHGFGLDRIAVAAARED